MYQIIQIKILIMLVLYVLYQFVKERGAQPPAKGGSRPQLTLIETYNGPQVTPSSIQHHSATSAFGCDNHAGAKLVWTRFTLVPLIYHLPNVHYAGIFGVDHKFIAIKKSFVRDGKGTSLPIIGIYLAICLDKCPSTGQEAADERENNCYHFQLNEVI